MKDIARQLRAQKRFSTDPGYLERMALEEERGSRRDLSCDSPKEKGVSSEARPGRQGKQ